MTNDLTSKTTFTFDEEQWRIIYYELPKSSLLRADIKDAIEDAQTFGTADLELDEAGTETLKALSLEFI